MLKISGLNKKHHLRIRRRKGVILANLAILTKDNPFHK